jgi:folate-binding protein YgfZ
LRLEKKDKINFLKSKYKKLFVNEEDRIEYFSSVKKEYDALVNGVGIRDISNNGKIKLGGQDVSDFLHRISTNDIKNLQDYQYVDTLFTNEKGRIIDKTTLLKMGNEYILINNSIYREKIKRWLHKYIITEKIAIHDVFSEYCLFEILGPHAESYLTLSCGNSIDEMENRIIRSVQIDTLEIKVIKKSKDLFWIIADNAKYMHLFEALTGYVSAFDPEMIGDKAYELYRIEHCTPVAPNEINDNYNPHEAMLLDIISFNKGCYIGQEVIARLDTYDKVQRQLVEIESPSSIDINGAEISLFDTNNLDVGRITSFINSKEYKRNIGLAYIRKDALRNNKRFTAKAQNEVYDIVVRDKKGQL